jgi:hypothetical protein
MRSLGDGALPCADISPLVSVPGITFPAEVAVSPMCSARLQL